MHEPKKLTLIHLVMGQKLLGKLQDENTAIQMVAVYNATGGQLVRAKKDPDLMQSLIDGAAEVEASEAQEVLRDFFGRITGYMNGITDSLPKVSPEMVELVMKMQGRKTPIPDPVEETPEESPTS